LIKEKKILSLINKSDSLDFTSEYLTKLADDFGSLEETLNGAILNIENSSFPYFPKEETINFMIQYQEKIKKF